MQFERDKQGGMYVFHDPPLQHGQTMPVSGGVFVGYSRTPRLRQHQRRNRIPAQYFDLLKERADRAPIYYQHIQAQVLADDPDVDTSIAWILKETPFCGTPERFPTNRSTPLAWCTADALLAMYLYISKQKQQDL